MKKIMAFVLVVSAMFLTACGPQPKQQYIASSDKYCTKGSVVMVDLVESRSMGGTWGLGANMVSYSGVCSGTILQEEFERNFSSK